MVEESQTPTPPWPGLTRPFPLDVNRVQESQTPFPPWPGLAGLARPSSKSGQFIRLTRHLDRMQRSAAFFAIPFDHGKALAALDAAVTNATTSLRVRLTLDEAGVFACTIASLGPPATGWTFAISPLVQSSGDPFLRHKTTWREGYDAEDARLSKLTGCGEVLFVNERGELTEGSRTNLFVRQGDRLLTPPLSSGLLDGVLRRELLDEARCEEAVLTQDGLQNADEVYLGNSLRGLILAKPVR